jgi:ABC-type antimicrobial peptide transport system permease subunit
MREAFAQLLRGKLRSFLTVCGFAVGIFSVITMGSMAEKFLGMGRHLADVFSNKIFICEKVSFWAGGGMLPESCVSMLRKADGSFRLVPFLVTRLRERQMFYLGFPEVAVGLPPGETADFCGNPPLGAGRWPADGEQSVLTGFDVSRSMDIAAGGRLRLRHRLFPVAGVLRKTGSVEDRMVFLPLSTAQEVFHRPSLLTGIMLKVPPGSDPDKLAVKVGRILPGIETVTPDEMKRQLDENLGLWNVVTVGSATLAFMVGTLCIMISMLVAFFERRREIGLRKALGASKADILSEFFLESLLVSMTGWLLGTLGGAVFITLYNRVLQEGGIALFHLSWRVVFLSLAGSALLGVLATLLPAWQASLVRPSEVINR